MSQTKTKPDPEIAAALAQWRAAERDLDEAPARQVQALDAAEEATWHRYERLCRERGVCIRPDCYEPTAWHTHRHCRKHREQRGES